MIETPAITTAPPGPTRRLGRPRRCSASDLPARLRRWHAPRANRWERVDVITGVLETEWLEPARIATLRLAAGTRHWVAPGHRWRLSRIDADTCFELATHADETIAADAPQIVREVMLDKLDAVRVEDPADVARLLDTLAPGEWRLLRTGPHDNGQLRASIRERGPTWFWHPLECGRGPCTALVARAPRPVALTEYLGRDHAVIESALAGALRGNGERARWLRNLLARHLAIEEQLLFPAYLDAGGNRDWIRGLLNEHRQLREHLPQLGAATSRRRLLLLLDGHDEKEEQIIYPDVLERLGGNAGTMACAAMHYPLVDVAP